MMDGCADRGQGLARDGVFGELFDSDHLLAAWARRLQRRSDLRSMELVAAVSRGVPMCAPVWSHRRPHLGVEGQAPRPSVIQRRPSCVPVLEPVAPANRSSSSSPEATIAVHRRLGTQLVIDDHYVSLVHAVVTFAASFSIWLARSAPLLPVPADIPVSATHSPCSAPQRPILRRPRQGRLVPTVARPDETPT